jgi:hypothetical protein
LIEQFGKGRIWAFDEAYEGIQPSPKFVQLVGASKWRPVFLQIVLMLLLGYWQRSTSFGRRVKGASRRDVREVTTQARDTGDFYFRAQKSRFALSRSLEYLRWQTKMQGADADAKKAAIELVKTGETELEGGENNVDRHAFLVRKMALAGKALESSSKGKHHDSV